MEIWIDEHPTWIPAWAGILSLLCIFGGIFSLVSLLISYTGGWAALAKRYRLRRPFVGTTFEFESGQMYGLASYRRCLTMGCNAEGLYLRLLFPFSIAQPPLLVPWSEVSVRSERMFLFTTCLRLDQNLAIPLWIRESLASKLKLAAGNSWPGYQPNRSAQKSL